MEKKNDTPIKTQVYNLVILDKSGSMESIRKEAIDGYNETLGSIRAAQLKHLDTQDHFVSLAAALRFLTLSERLSRISRRIQKTLRTQLFSLRSSLTAMRTPQRNGPVLW